jgi:hypothetical protein
MKLQQVYLSDDESEDGKGAMNKGKSQPTHLREFEGLAMVDLTQPLREDEVISRRAHRSLPEPMVDPDKHGKEKKKKKKEKAVNQERLPSNGLGTTTVDLLDLASFTFADTSVKKADQPIASQSVLASNPMDDLLSLTLPIQEALVVPATTHFRKESSSSVSSSFSKETELWQELKLKTSLAKGSGPNVDWERVLILYRTFFSKDHRNKAILSFQLTNSNKEGALTDVRLSIRDTDTVITFEDTQPGASSRSTIKAGPFTVTENQSSKEIRGNFMASGWVVPFKLTLPSVCYLLMETVSMDEISEEMSKGSLNQFTLKLNVSENFDRIRIKSLLKFFLRAIEASSDRAPSLVSYILVSTSASGRVFIFVKISDGVIKIDLKTSDENLGQSLCSDLKRIRFV